MIIHDREDFLKLPSDIKKLRTWQNIFEKDTDLKARQKISQLQELEEWNLMFLYFTEPVGPVLEELKKLKNLKKLDLSFSDPAKELEARKKLFELGMMELKSTDGIIGAWYESGKEIGSNREFMPTDGPRRGFEFSLGKGDFLKIYSPQGDVLFSGELSGGRDQEGVDVIVWHNYFNQKLKATLTTYEPTSRYEITFHTSFY
jgi:hypothetical protein